MFRGGWTLSCPLYNCDHVIFDVVFVYNRVFDRVGGCDLHSNRGHHNSMETRLDRLQETLWVYYTSILLSFLYSSLLGHCNRREGELIIR